MGDAMSVAARRAPRSWPAPVQELNDVVVLAGRAAARAVRPPLDYGPELVATFRFALQIGLVPMIITSFALSFGPAGIQATNFLGLLGAIDRLGGVYVLIVIREFAPLVSGIVVAGAIGTAICADLGARKVRDEIDALQVLGVDPIKALVVPRLITLVVFCVLGNVFALLAGMSGAALVVVQNNGAFGPFFETFFNNATPLEFAASFVKCGLYGAVIALVCCHRGLTVSGGPAAVGIAVNRAVVTSFLAIGFVDYGFNQILLSAAPTLTQLR
jgi:phospholipid/cholesterol/gamma-HCH transport system permease protein